jgi:signal transduction histidine kinase
MTDRERPEPAPIQPEQIREVDRWMYQFTAQLAHDMRAPMGAIFMWAHVLRAADTGENRAAIDAIEASARQQSRMLGDVVDMARALVGRLRLECARTELASVVSAAVEEKAKDAAARRVTVEWSGGPAEPRTTFLVKADAKRLQQAFACLIAYAIANSNGKRVSVRLVAEPATHHVQVRVGLPAAGEVEALEHLFLAYRAEGLDLAAARPDFGMGLPFARAVLRLHDGDVGVENQGAGGGLTFVARLPADREAG